MPARDILTARHADYGDGDNPGVWGEFSTWFAWDCGGGQIGDGETQGFAQVGDGARVGFMLDAGFGDWQDYGVAFLPLHGSLCVLS